MECRFRGFMRISIGSARRHATTGRAAAGTRRAEWRRVAGDGTQREHMTMRRVSRCVLALILWGSSPIVSRAQAPVGAPPYRSAVAPGVSDAQTPSVAPGAPTTRIAQIELARRQKDATLWPERESPLVARANRLLNRGLFEGIQTGEGNN